MRGMDAEEVRRQPAQETPRRERLLAAIIPAPLQRPISRAPQPLPELPARRLPTIEPHCVVLGMATLDSSGRVHDRTILTALDWPPGQRLDITSLHDAIVVQATPAGLHTIGARGDLTLPAAARALSGILANSRVVLAAFVDQDLLLVHPPTTVAALLCTHYITLDEQYDN